MRSLGIDYGRKRIGLALSDPSLLFASPYDTIANKGFARAVARISEVIALNDVDTVVVGLPLHSNGEESEMSREARAFGDRVAALGIPVEYMDERGTSMEAEDIIRGSGETNRKKIANLIDKVAASVILQTYLNSKGEERKR